MVTLQEDNRPTLYYSSSRIDDSVLCSWIIRNISWETIEKIQNWTDNKIQLKGPNIWFRRLNNNEPAIYELNIKGRGYDDRCTWCKSFRTALNSSCIKDYNSIVQYKSCCDFD